MKDFQSDRQTGKSGFLSIFLFLTSLLILQGCQTFHDISIEKDGKRYGVTNGLFKGQWWHHYERALSFAEGGFWKEAKLDLKEAIRLRKGDKKRAKAYSGRYIDYFPHRELGIIYYKQGRFQEAVRELKTSLSTEKSSQAESYLKLAVKKTF